MRTKRNLFLLAALLIVSAAAWGVVGAQDATPAATPETETAQTTEARPFLGVLLEESESGVVVSQVTEGSAAADAGLKAGDVITAVNGTAVASVTEVADAIKALAVGDEVTIDVTRAGETVSVTATLGAYPSSEFAIPGLPSRHGNLGALQLGEMGIEYDAEAKTYTITSLSEDSALYEAGLREGDVINTVDDQAYDQAGLLQYLISLEDDATVTLNVTRDGAAQDIQLPARDLTALFIPGGFNFRFGGSEMPRGFQNMIPGMQGGMLANGWLGVSFTTLDADTAAANNVTVTDGALIKEVAEGSPAAEAGLQAGDVVTAVNGEAVDAEHTLRDRMIAYEAGDVVTLTVLRNGDTMEVEATLAEPQMQQFDMSQLGDLFQHGMPFDFGGRDGNGGFHFQIPVPAQPEAPAATGANM